MSRRTLILIGLAFFALALYMAGLETGAYILFALAFVVELWFWFKLFKQRNKNQSKSE